MKGKKWALLITLGFILSIFLIACNDDSKKDNKKAGTESEQTDKTKAQNGEEKLAADQTLNVNIKAEPHSLDPRTAIDVTAGTVLGQLFEGLMRLDQEDSEPELAMAEDYEISDDQLTYTFKIRQDAKWSNGDPVTAKDFEYAWKWIIEPDSKDTDYAYQLYPIKGAQAAKEEGAPMDEVGIKAEDDQTLVVTLEQPTPYFLEMVAFHTFYPVNHKIAEQNENWARDFTEDYVSNGPFVMEKWEHKNEIVLSKNENYWDADTVQLETINMVMIDDENTAKQMYDNGELDWIGRPLDSLPLAALPAFKEDGTLNVATATALYYYVINTEEEPFNNANIRKAFALAINREGIVENITKGGQPPATAFVPPTIFTENEEGYFKDNDIEEAKKYLKKGMEELGLEELPPITLSYNTAESHAAIAQAIQDMWRENLDVQVELHNEEWAVFLDTLSEGNFQIGRYGWGADFKDAINFLEVYETKGGNNSTNWENKEYQDLLAQSRMETDENKRYELLRQAEAILMEEMPIIPIYFESIPWVNKDYVKNINVSPLSHVQFKWGYIAEH